MKFRLRNWLALASLLALIVVFARICYLQVAGWYPMPRPSYDNWTLLGYTLGTLPLFVWLLSKALPKRR